MFWIQRTKKDKSGKSGNDVPWEVYGYSMIDNCAAVKVV